MLMRIVHRTNIRMMVMMMMVVVMMFKMMFKKMFRPLRFRSASLGNVQFTVCVAKNNQ